MSCHERVKKGGSSPGDDGIFGGLLYVQQSRSPEMLRQTSDPGGAYLCRNPEQLALRTVRWRSTWTGYAG